MNSQKAIGGAFFFGAGLALVFLYLIVGYLPRPEWTFLFIPWPFLYFIAGLPVVALAGVIAAVLTRKYTEGTDRTPLWSYIGWVFLAIAVLAVLIVTLYIVFNVRFF